MDRNRKVLTAKVRLEIELKGVDTFVHLQRKCN